MKKYIFSYSTVKNITKEIKEIYKNADTFNICSKKFLDIMMDKRKVNLEPANQIILLWKNI